MSNEINDGGPAYPFTELESSGAIYHQHPGMTLRDEFAKAAMQGELAAMRDPDGDVCGVALDASDETLARLTKHWYRLADAMLAARAKPQPTDPVRDAATDMLEALRECVDLAWFEDSHRVSFDRTVMFGLGYDFSGIDGPSRQEFLGAVECIVWPSGGIGESKWSAYCTNDGSLWFERFKTAEQAKEVCMRLLDRVLPDHPAMKARAAIAKATGKEGA